MSEWTQDMVNMHNLRVSKENQISQAPLNPHRSEPRTGGEGVSDESELHADILAECRRRGWLALHGSMAHRSRRTAGEFDFVILIPPMTTSRRIDKDVLFVEAKTRLGKLSPAQQALHAHARHLGHEVHVVRSMEEFLEIL